MAGDCPIAAVSLSDEQKKQLNMEDPKKLPLSVTEARDLLTADEDFKNSLGTEFVELYLQVNKVGVLYRGSTTQ